MYQEAEFQKSFRVLWASMLEYGVVISQIQKNDQEWRVVHDAWNTHSGNFDGQKPADVIPLEGLGERINWERTTIPFYQTLGEFVSTDDPSDQIECMIGKLVLKGGDTFWVGSREINDVMRANKKMLDTRTLMEPEPDLLAKWGI